MKIPSSSISRIALYYRVLLSLKDTNIISSQEIATLAESTAAQVRKDFAYFGQFGRPGCGYAVESLKKELKTILGMDRNWDVALIGVGNLGSALLAYKGFNAQGFNIKYAFDNDAKKIQKTKPGFKIYDIKHLKQVIKGSKVPMAIVAVPYGSAQKVIDDLVFAGIKAVLNFAPIRPKVPNGVKVLNIDLSMELERLTYFLKTNQ